MLIKLYAWVSTAIQRLLPQHKISQFFGWLASIQSNQFIILWMKFWWHKFCGKYGEVKPNFQDYQSFNDFFTRDVPYKLASDAYVSPCEGNMLDSGRINEDLSISVKYDMLSIEMLLGKDNQWAKNGSFAVIYLAPGDYHCVHSTRKGTLVSVERIAGKLFSVNPNIMQCRQYLLSSNERVVMRFEQGDQQWAVVMVGALVVGGIHTIWDDESVAKEVAVGQKIGEFRLGSTVVLVENQVIDFNNANHLKVGELLTH